MTKEKRILSSLIIFEFSFFTLATATDKAGPSICISILALFVWILILQTLPFKVEARLLSIYNKIDSEHLNRVFIAEDVESSGQLLYLTFSKKSDKEDIEPIFKIGDKIDAQVEKVTYRIKGTINYDNLILPLSYENEGVKIYFEKAQVWKVIKAKLIK